jgi:hypothetical protein
MTHGVTVFFKALELILILAGAATGAYSLHLEDSCRDRRKSEADIGTLRGRAYRARSSLYAAIAGGLVCELIVTDNPSDRLFTGLLVFLMLTALWGSSVVREKRTPAKPTVKPDPGSMLHISQ